MNSKAAPLYSIISPFSNHQEQTFIRIQVVHWCWAGMTDCTYTHGQNNECVCVRVFCDRCQPLRILAIGTQAQLLLLGALSARVNTWLFHIYIPWCKWKHGCNLKSTDILRFWNMTKIEIRRLILYKGQAREYVIIFKSSRKLNQASIIIA